MDRGDTHTNDDKSSIWYKKRFKNNLVINLMKAFKSYFNTMLNNIELFYEEWVGGWVSGPFR